jgi:hypothetical protein
MRINMTDETITRALVALRRKTVREGRPGLKHVEALLKLQGEPLAPVPRMNNVRFPRNKLRLAILRALRDGPLRTGQVCDRVCEENSVERTQTRYENVACALRRMRDKGDLGHERPVWWIAT